MDATSPGNKTQKSLGHIILSVTLSQHDQEGSPAKVKESQANCLKRLLGAHKSQAATKTQKICSKLDELSIIII